MNVGTENGGELAFQYSPLANSDAPTAFLLCQIAVTDSASIYSELYGSEFMQCPLPT